MIKLNDFMQCSQKTSKVTGFFESGGSALKPSNRGITQAYKNKVDFMSITGGEADINTTLNFFTYIMLVW